MHAPALRVQDSQIKLGLGLSGFGRRFPFPIRLLIILVLECRQTRCGVGGSRHRAQQQRPTHPKATPRYRMSTPLPTNVVAQRVPAESDTAATL